MSELDKMPTELPPQRRFEMLKGLAIGFALIGTIAMGSFNGSFAIALTALIASLVLVIILFCKKRPKMACGILLALISVPLLVFGACVSMVNF